MSRRSGACLRCCLVVFAVASALAVCGPALYWRFKNTINLHNSKLSCPPCVCDCPPPLSLLQIAPVLRQWNVVSERFELQRLVSFWDLLKTDNKISFFPTNLELSIYTIVITDSGFTDFFLFEHWDFTWKNMRFRYPFS
ncbi:uncharacterized protein LOC114713537 isoform X2 [Neltuma alba]|uniref:uncharacterized protein LOC114713537 isoform X2 n=1 Tax=Neltuma alba TaxID=207710 RepID=UPI0010A50268|nr:uncharacterized protein LOC114713537 isoform X2 [Prosopis alba]